MAEGFHTKLIFTPPGQKAPISTGILYPSITPVPFLPITPPTAFEKMIDNILVDVTLQLGVPLKIFQPPTLISAHAPATAISAHIAGRSTVGEQLLDLVDGASLVARKRMGLALSPFQRLAIAFSDAPLVLQMRAMVEDWDLRRIMSEVG